MLAKLSISVVKSKHIKTVNFECMKELWLHLWQIMVILFIYLVICNLHVQKKSIRANLSVRHLKLPPYTYFRLLRASYFMLLGRIWEWWPILNAGKKWLHLWQIMVILFVYLVIYNLHVQKNQFEPICQLDIQSYHHSCTSDYEGHHILCC